MASAWGKSWGGAFGAAFGAVVLVAAPPSPVNSSGGGIFRDPSVTTLFTGMDQEQDLRQQIQQEDETILMVIAQLMVNGEFA